MFLFVLQESTSRFDRNVKRVLKAVDWPDAKKLKRSHSHRQHHEHRHEDLPPSSSSHQAGPSSSSTPQAGTSSTASVTSLCGLPLFFIASSWSFITTYLHSYCQQPALASRHSCSNLGLTVRLVVFVFSYFTYPTSLLGVQALLMQQPLTGSATRRGTESEPRSGWHRCACSSWPLLTRQSASGRSLFLNPLLSVFFRPLFSCSPKQTMPKPEPGCTC